MVHRERRLTYGGRRAAQKRPETIIAAIANAIGIPGWTRVDPRNVRNTYFTHHVGTILRQCAHDQRRRLEAEDCDRCGE